MFRIRAGTLHLVIQVLAVLFIIWNQLDSQPADLPACPAARISRKLRVGPIHLEKLIGALEMFGAYVTNQRLT